MKKYLKSIKDVEALRNTDTKIYEEYYNDSYWKFVNGILCKFYTDNGGFTYNTCFTIDVNSRLYIEVPDKSDKSWIGKLGWFWDSDEKIKTIDVLIKVGLGRFWSKKASEHFSNFRPLTPEEVEKYTGYKVIKEN